MFQATRSPGRYFTEYVLHVQGYHGSKRKKCDHTGGGLRVKQPAKHERFLLLFIDKQSTFERPSHD